MFWRKKESKPAMPETGEPVAMQSEESAAKAVTQTPPETTEASHSIEYAQLEGKVIEAISTVFDPEIPVNIYELGLIYDIDIDGMSDVKIKMTLTSPACPVAGSLPGDVQRVVEGVENVRAVDVDLVWEPPWTPDRMSEAAKLELGFM
jgi:FeS assembly SUF system protein